MTIALAIAAVVGPIAFFAIRAAITPDDASAALQRQTVLTVTIPLAGLALLLVVLVFAFSAYNRARQRHVQGLRPGARVFTATQVVEFQDALPSLRVDGPKLGTAFAVSIGDAGVELWRDRVRATPSVAIPWRSIIAVSVGTATSRGRNSEVALPALVLTLDDGTLLPLTVSRADGGLPAPQDELDALAASLQVRVAS